MADNAQAAGDDKMAEDVPPEAAWEALRRDPQARLVDVRTEGEWRAVGVPDTAEAGAEVVLLPWQFSPAEINAGFVDGLAEAGLTPENHLYFICRSGARSQAAAEAARAAGYPTVYNVASGYEGSRSGVGWKAAGLPAKSV
jgi:rhodanese-related sulfurtransferase